MSIAVIMKKRFPAFLLDKLAGLGKIKVSKFPIINCYRPTQPKLYLNSVGNGIEVGWSKPHHLNV